MAHALPMTFPRLPVLLLVLLAGAQAPAATPSGPAAPPDSMRKLAKRELELYAPTDKDIRGANDEIRIAMSQFGHHMGESPKKMAFLVFRTAADADRYNYRDFVRRNVPAVPWILPPTPPGRPASAAAKLPPDPISHSAGHQFLIAYTEHVLAQGRPEAPVDEHTIVVPTKGLPGGRVAVSGTHPDHAALPDWLEEAIASLCERPSFQKGRMDFIRARLGRHIPFAEFMAMPRPGAAASSGSKPPKAGGGGAAGAKGEAQAATPGGAEAERMAIFCAQALSLGRFIAHREDPRFVGTIVEGVLRGRTASDVLNTSQNLNSKPEALEKQWREWMEWGIQ